VEESRREKRTEGWRRRVLGEEDEGEVIWSMVGGGARAWREVGRREV